MIKGLIFLPLLCLLSCIASAQFRVGFDVGQHLTLGVTLSGEGRINDKIRTVIGGGSTFTTKYKPAYGDFSIFALGGIKYNRAEFAGRAGIAVFDSRVKGFIFGFQAGFQIVQGIVMHGGYSEFEGAFLGFMVRIGPKSNSK